MTRLHVRRQQLPHVQHAIRRYPLHTRTTRARQRENRKPYLFLELVSTVLLLLDTHCEACVNNAIFSYREGLNYRTILGGRDHLGMEIAAEQICKHRCAQNQRHVSQNQLENIQLVFVLFIVVLRSFPSGRRSHGNTYLECHLGLVWGGDRDVHHARHHCKTHKETESFRQRHQQQQQQQEWLELRRSEVRGAFTAGRASAIHCALTNRMTQLTSSPRRVVAPRNGTSIVIRS